MDINDKEKDQLRVIMATTEREGMRGAAMTMTNTAYTGNEERGWYSISLLYNAMSLPWCNNGVV